MKPKNLVVFDMDGVIIDVSASYRDVVRKTARLFFQPAQGADKLPDPLFELADLAAVKQSGGLNNDWDLTFVVIKLLFALVDPPAVHPDQDPWTRYRKTIGCCDAAALAAFLNSQDTPLTSLIKQPGQPENDFIAGLYAGDVGSGNIIKQIFQEIYLGTELFRTTYNLEPEIYRGEGLILREKVLIDHQLLAELSQNNVLAIATGRPKAEADYPLQHYNLDRFFATVMTLDDCLREEQRLFEEGGQAVSLSKPHPFMLDAIAQTCKDDVGACYYVGDMPDDMLAAARSTAGYKGIGLLLAAPDKESLKTKLIQTGADHIIDNFEALKKIIL